MGKEEKYGEVRTQPQFLTTNSSKGSIKVRVYNKDNKLINSGQGGWGRRYLIVRPRLALENRSDVETDGLDLPEEPRTRTVLHHSFYLESQLLGVLHWDWFTWCSWGWRKGKLKKQDIPGSALRELKTEYPLKDGQSLWIRHHILLFAAVLCNCKTDTWMDPYVFIYSLYCLDNDVKVKKKKKKNPSRVHSVDVILKIFTKWSIYADFIWM